MTIPEQHEVIEQAINAVADQVRETLAEIGDTFYEGKRRLHYLNTHLSALSNKPTVSRFRKEVRKDNPFAVAKNDAAVDWGELEEQPAKKAKKK